MRLTQFLCGVLVSVILVAPRAADSAEDRAGAPVEVQMDADLRLRVWHAPSKVMGALVYLHGMCSGPRPADIWAEEALRYGTLIALRANEPCGDRPGNKWPKDPGLIQARIERALAKVRELRHGDLDTSQVTLIGYSQGAYRAEALSALFMERYPRLLLGGPPTAAEAPHFSQKQRVAIIAGELEDSAHMRRGAEALAAARIPVRFLVFPKAAHGDFGPEGAKIFRDALAWLHGAGLP